MLQEIKINHIYQGNCLDILKTFPDDCIDCVVTSPPYYGLRSYQTTPQIWGGNTECCHEWGGKNIKKQSGDIHGNVGNNCNDRIHFTSESSTCSLCGAWCGELGQEPNFNMFIDHLVEIFMECKRVMKPTGSLWVNIADSYRGSGNGIGGNEDEGKQVYLLKNKANIKSNLKGYNKSLLGIPERLCIALTDKGLLRRSTIIWHKRNCLPSSATDRFTNDFEYFYFFTKSPKYYFKQQFEPLKTESKKRAMRGSSGKGKYANGEQFPEGVHAMTMLQEREHIGYNDMEEKIASGQTLLNPMGRNKRTVWTLTNKSYRKAHFAVFQEALITTPIDACCPEKICVKCGKAINIRINTKSIATRPNKTTKDINGEFATDRQRFMPVLIGEELEVCNCNAGFKPGIVLDPFFGSGTSGKVAIEQGKDFIGLELNPEYIKLAEDRIKAVQIKMF